MTVSAHGDQIASFPLHPVYDLFGRFAKGHLDFCGDAAGGELGFSCIQAGLALLDFGMVVRVPPDTRLHLIRTVLAAVRQDGEGIVEGFNALGLIAADADMMEIRRLVQLLLDTAYRQDTTTQDRIKMMLADRVMHTLYDFPVVLPRDMVYFARTASLIEGLGTRYDRYFQAIPVASPIVLRMRSRILRSLGETPTPSVAEIATIAGFAAGRLWKRVRRYAQSKSEQGR